MSEGVAIGFSAGRIFLQAVPVIVAGAAVYLLAMFVSCKIRRQGCFK